ncbi:MAG: response regulator, partial [Methanoregula sp.]|nr:response regulator [Methanoregula sp.]
MDKQIFKVLLIEDDPDDVFLLRGMIEESQEDLQKFEIETADRLSVGLSRLSQGNIDILLLDLGLPDSMGINTLRTARAHAPEMTIVVLTGHVDSHVGILALQEGAQDYQVKGLVNGPLLVRSMRYSIERKRQEHEKEKLIQELKAALARIRTLSGMLPICASCKNIRDDTGYWHQIESYISEHSETEFSHGICPDCMNKLYPDYK